MAGSGSNPNPGKDRPFISRSPSDQKSQARPQILVVEDNGTDLFLIRDALQSAQVDADVHNVQDGHAATKFFDGIDADSKLLCPTLILLDMNLPKKSGDEVLKHLRGSYRCRSAMVLIVSTSDLPRDREVVDNLGISGYFKKPSSYTEFMKLGPLVKNLLQGRKDR